MNISRRPTPLREQRRMNCPRCEIELESVEVAGFQAQLCRKCEGAWFEGKGPAVMRDVPPEVLETSPLAPTLVADHKPDKPLDAPIQCPVCRKEMNSYEYLGEIGTWVDFCSQHGVWLDDGELPGVLAALRLEPQLLEEPENSKKVPNSLQRLTTWFRSRVASE